MSCKIPSRILSIAPQVVFPVRSGGARRLSGIIEAYDLLGVDSFAAVRNGTITGRRFTVKRTPNSPEIVAKSIGALKALLLRRSYNEVRFAHSRWFRRNYDFLKDCAGDLVVVHFLATVPAFLKSGLQYKTLAIETHNNDWEWWSNFSNGSKAASWVSKAGYRRVNQILRMIPQDAVLVHLSEADYSAYREYLPRHRHFLLPNGCNKPINANSDGSGHSKPRLLFLGSLSSRINQDALNYFFQNFWPILMKHSSLTVAGSNPPGWVATTVEEVGANLRPDLGENEISDLLATHDFLVLPFEYGAGSKLKVMDALSHGMPVISTVPGLCGIAVEEIQRAAFVSNRPEDWRDFVVESAHTKRQEMSHAALEWAKMQTWDRHVAGFFNFLNGSALL